MAINESIEKLRTTLSDITTSLGNKGVTAEGLKASQVPDKIREIELVIELGDPVAGNANELFSGLSFNDKYPAHIIFTDQIAPRNTQVVNWTADGGNGVVKWWDSVSDTLYVSSQREGVKIIFPVSTSQMFYNMISIQTISFNNVTTSQVTDMSQMFSGCSALETLELSCFDTSQVTNMSYMFNSCGNLNPLNLDSFETANVKDMEGMFANCYSLTSLDLSRFITNNVTNMDNMFANCSQLISLDLSNFDTSLVTNMYQMFYNCFRLKTLDLSEFDVKSLAKNSYGANEMFSRCSDLSTIYAKEWTNMNDLSSYTKNMFYSCTNLPNFRSSNTTFTKAKWKENSGYFTNPSEKGN